MVSMLPPEERDIIGLRNRNVEISKRSDLKAFDPAVQNTFNRIATYIAQVPLSTKTLVHVYGDGYNDVTVTATNTGGWTLTDAGTERPNTIVVEVDGLGTNDTLNPGQAVLLMQYSLARLCHALGDQVYGLNAEVETYKTPAYKEHWMHVGQDISNAIKHLAKPSRPRMYAHLRLDEYVIRMNRLVSADGRVWFRAVREENSIVVKGGDRGSCSLDFATVPSNLAEAVALSFAFTVAHYAIARKDVTPLTAAWQQIVADIKMGGGHPRS